MSDALLAAIIGAVVSLIGSLLNNWSQRKKKAVEEAEKETELKFRLESIEHKLDVHNGYAEKLGTIQADIAVIKTEIKNIKEAR